MLSLLKALDPARLTGSGGDRKQGGRKEGEKAREKWKEREKGLGKRKEEESWKGRRNNEGFRASVAHGSGCTSVPAASGQQLLTAQRVGAESLSQHREPACRSGGARLASANCFFFPLSSFIKAVC